MDDYAFDFSDYKPWTEFIHELRYDSCATCGKMIPMGLKRCYDCEFHKPHIEKKDTKIMMEIAEAIDILKK